MTEIETYEKVIILRNYFKSDTEQINFYKWCINSEIEYDSKSFKSSIEKLNFYSRDPVIKTNYYSYIDNIGSFTIDDDNLIYSNNYHAIYKFMCQIFNHMKNHLAKDHFIHKIDFLTEKSFAKYNYCTIGLLYNQRAIKKKQESIVSHYDNWSDWNLMISIGGSSKLLFPRDKEIIINSGDIVLFNGNNKLHAVQLIEGTTNKLWNDKINFGAHRFCYQLRRQIR
jgi:hypothetical protein